MNGNSQLSLKIRVLRSEGSFDDLMMIYAQDRISGKVLIGQLTFTEYDTGTEIPHSAYTEVSRADLQGLSETLMHSGLIPSNQEPPMSDMERDAMSSHISDMRETRDLLGELLMKKLK